jgi:hypothetical protein
MVFENRLVLGIGERNIKENLHSMGLGVKNVLE